MCNRRDSQSQLSKDVMILRNFARFCGPFIVSMSLHSGCARTPPAIFAIAAIRIVRRRRIPAAADKRPLDPANHRSAGSWRSSRVIILISYHNCCVVAESRRHWLIRGYELFVCRELLFDFCSVIITVLLYLKHIIILFLLFKCLTIRISRRNVV